MRSPFFDRRELSMKHRQRTLWNILTPSAIVELFIFLNVSFLVADVYVAHSMNGFVALGRMDTVWLFSGGSVSIAAGDADFVECESSRYDARSNSLHAAAGGPTARAACRLGSDCGGSHGTRVAFE